MSGKFTAGPWKADARNGFVTTGGEEILICQLWNKFEDDFPNASENIKVLATAPDGYALAKMVVDYYGDTKCLSRTEDEIRAAARALTAKVEGK